LVTIIAHIDALQRVKKIGYATLLRLRVLLPTLLAPVQ